MNGRLMCVSCALFAAAAVVRAVDNSSPVPAFEPLATLSSSLGSWQLLHEHALDRETLNVLRADDYVSRTYATPTTAVDVFVALYATQREGDAIHSPMNCLPGTGWQPLAKERVTLDGGNGRPINVNRVLIQKSLDKRLVFYWYQSHGRTIASEYAAKAYLVFDSIRLGRSDAALVRVITSLDRGESSAEQSAREFIRSLFPALQSRLSL